MRKYFSSVIVVLLCFTAAYRMIVPQSCGGMIDGFHLIVFGLLLITYIVILILYNIYKRVALKKSFNFIPFITLVITLLIISSIEYLQSEKFKSKRIFEAENSHYHFLARADHTYLLTKKYVDYACREDGFYVIKHDTLYLSERPDMNITNYHHEVFLINTQQGVLIPVYKDSTAKDKNNFLLIQ